MDIGNNMSSTGTSASRGNTCFHMVFQWWQTSQNIVYAHHYFAVMVVIRPAARSCVLNVLLKSAGITIDQIVNDKLLPFVYLNILIACFNRIAFFYNSVYFGLPFQYLPSNPPSFPPHPRIHSQREMGQGL